MLTATPTISFAAPSSGNFGVASPAANAPVAVSPRSGCTTPGYGVSGKRRLFYPTYWLGRYIPPAPIEPPLKEVIGDTKKNLEKGRSKRQLDGSDYAHLNRRLNDLKEKSRSLEMAAGGTLDAGVEEDLRKDIRQVQSEADRRMQP